MRTEGGGFLGGAALGLVLALLLVGGGSLYSRQPLPQQAPTSTSTSTSTSAEFAGGVPFASVAANSSLAAVNAGAPAQSGASAPPEVSNQASVNGSNAKAGPGSLASTVTAPQIPLPSSTLSMLPAEGVATLVVTLAPVLIGLVLAAAVYGVYARRQDASS